MWPARGAANVFAYGQLGLFPRSVLRLTTALSQTQEENMRIARRRPANRVRFTSQASRAVRSAIDTLESRRHLDASYFNLAGGQLLQDWSNVGLITTDDNWSGVPSIQGFRGDGLAGGTAVDPQTITAANDPGVLDVNANRSDPSVFNTGGVAEFDGIPNPVVAFQGSGTARAPYLQFYLNTTGLTPAAGVPITYNLRDVDAGFSNAPTNTTQAIQPVALQYRVGTTGVWTNIPSGFVANANDVGDTKVTAVATNLPTDANNQAQVQVRIMMSDAVGTDAFTGVDDIVIGSPSTTPTFTLNTNNLSVNEGAGTVSVNVIPSNITTSTTVRIRTVAGSAVAGSDYSAIDQLLTFTNNTQQTISVPLTNDGVAEATESFVIELYNPAAGSQTGTPSVATISVIDNDQQVPSSPVIVNEVNTNPPGNDGSNEYIEIRGTPGQSLFGVKLLVIKGNPLSSPNGSGGIDNSFDLSGLNIGSSGYLVIKSSTGGPAIPSGTTVVTDAIFDNAASAVGGIRDDSVSFALVFNQNPIFGGIDLDTTDLGTLSLPAGSTMLDAVGYLSTNTANHRVYGANVTILPNAVGAISRFADNLAANTDAGGASDPAAVAAWASGNLQGTDPAGLLYNVPTSSTNLASVSAPALTPGAANFLPTSGPGTLQFTTSALKVFENVSTITFTVTRTAGSVGAVSANWATSNGSAVAPGDYTAASGTVSFGAGDLTPQTFTVTVNNDTLAEADETFNLTLTNPTNGATLGTNSVVNVTIGASDQTAPVVINEVLANPPGNDGPGFEYIELRGTPGLNVGGLYVLGVEGDAGGTQGLANLVLQLPTGALIGSNGLLLIRGTTSTPASIEAGTSIVTFAALDSASGAIQNGSQSVILVNPGSNTFTTTSDLDAANNGVLTLPSGATLLDAVGWKDVAAATDFAYGVDLTQLNGTALRYTNEAVSRLVDEGTPLSGGAWFGGTLQTAAPTLYQPTFAASGNPASFNLPTGSGSPNITPGGVNYPGTVVDTTPPTVTSKVKNYITGLSVAITFSEDVSASLASGDFTLVNNTTPVSINASNINVSYNTSTNVATLTFTGVTGASVPGTLPNGNYTLSFGGTANAIEDAAGNDLAAESFGFKWVTGDSNDSGSTNFDDLLVLAANYNTTLSGPDYSKGDFNYSGNVNFDDLLLLAANYNVVIAGNLGAGTLLAPPPAPATGSDTEEDDTPSFGDSVIA
jgi:hypothetical protein